LSKAILHTAFHDILQVNYAKCAASVGNRKRSSSPLSYTSRQLGQFGWNVAALLPNELDNGLCGALSNLAAVDVCTAHPGVRRKRDELCLAITKLTAAQVVFRSFWGPTVVHAA
jgi:hypothetical protein